MRWRAPALRAGRDNSQFQISDYRKIRAQDSRERMRECN
jgi:hypothetical protein